LIFDKCEFSESGDENELRKPPRISKTLPVGQIGTIEPIEGCENQIRVK